MSRLLRHFGVLPVGLIAALAVACSGTGEPTGPVESAPTASPTQTATAAPTQTAAAAPTPAKDYDSTENMFRLFSGRGYIPNDAREAITLAAANNDKSMVPVMIEMLRFFGNRQLVVETHAAISAITGQEFGSGPGAWNEWMEWLGKNADEYGPPDGYVEWKSALMSLIDPRFGEFLAPAAQGSRIKRIRDRVGRRPARRNPRTSKTPRSFRRASRTTCYRATGSSACPSTESTGRTRSAS